MCFFFFSSRRRHTRWPRDWSSDVCSSDLIALELEQQGHGHVHVTCVCPSYVATGLFDGARPPRMTRLLTADRVADLTVRGMLANRPYVRAPWLVKVTPLMKALMPFRVFY